ncbi:MAG: MFS transporter [bacterium]|nr:MFS transporter [bacterium]
MSAFSKRRLATWVIFATILIDFIGFSILIPVLPRFLDVLGVAAFHVPLITALYALGLVLFLPLWGWASDRVGRRPILLTSLLGTAASFFLLATADSLLTIYVARLLGGFFGASIGAAQAYMTDLTDSETRTEGMGLIGAASGIGLVLGTALGGVLAWVDLALPFYATAAVAGLNFLLAAWTLPESRAPGSDNIGWGGFARAMIPAPLLVAASVHDNRTRLYLYLFLHIFFAFSAIEAMFPLFARERFMWNELQIGLYMAAVACIMGLIQGLAIAPLTRIWGDVRLTIGGLGLMGCAILGIAVSFNFGVLMLSGGMLALGSGLAFPAFTSLFSRVAADHEAGEYMSQSQAMVNTGRTIGSFCWGWVFYTAGAGAPFLISGLSTLGAMAIFVAGSRLLLARN